MHRTNRAFVKGQSIATNRSPPAERSLACLTVPAEDAYQSAVLAVVRALAAGQGLSGPAVEQLGSVVKEACANVIARAYPPGSSGDMDILILRRPGKLVVAVEDQGLPFNFTSLEEGERSGLAAMVGRGCVCEIHCRCLGRQGNLVEITYTLPAAAPSADAEVEQTRAAAPPAPPDAALELRLLRPDDTVGLVRLLYRCYGYSYDANYMYDPDRVRELLASGLMRSCIAVSSGGETVGHLALHLERPDALVAEAAQGMVDPRYRGHALFERMKSFLREDARARGMYGICSEAVTLHPYSQKGSLALGARETGLLLAYIPAGVSYKQIEDIQAQRQAVLLLYLPVNEAPDREVHLPPHHEPFLRRLFGHIGLKRKPCTAPARAPTDKAQVDVRVSTDHNEAFLRVRQFGDDLAGLVHFRLKELCLERLDCVYLDLPLSDPAAALACERLERLGFFFGGIVPELAAGDVLRLQYLNEVAVDPARIQLASDFGKELLAYVLAARAAAPQIVCN